MAAAARRRGGGRRPGSEAEEAVVDFAEQFSIDVTGISEDRRQRLVATLRGEAFGAVVLTYIADFVPRVLAGLGGLGLGDLPPAGETSWDHTTDADFNGFLPAVARRTALDPVTAEIGYAIRFVTPLRSRPADPRTCTAIFRFMQRRRG